ncbi:mitogen-activated protein kinase kinase kinase 5 isoform X3 [Strongylocentrotus purpuratus]|uniref:mitogen-activated protein kinase kinase kinase n=1 Tax=Strongylocentrotus purpuratus TaxID=7668 RepID=A0A7M7PLM6_STRPU|nr:mitogen-activated protein kinase kinase kinase 5 isoform X3 [Strongylocentrotus purpuratus]
MKEEQKQLTKPDRSMSTLGTSQLRIACVFSATSSDTKLAEDALNNACRLVNNVTLIKVNFDRLDFGETKVLDRFYAADIVVVDVSVIVQQRTLFYHMGVRESFGKEKNVVLYNDSVDPEGTSSLMQSCHGSGYIFIPYKMDSKSQCYVCDMACVFKAGQLCEEDSALCPLLTDRLRETIEEVHISNRSNATEVLLNDIRKARIKLKGETLAKELGNLKARMDEQLLLSGDIVHQFLLSYREIQDYNSMVSLVEAIKQLKNDHVTDKPAILHLYAFALNRRKKPGDREKAVTVITKALESDDNQVPDMFCLCGRIYKDIYTESNYLDFESRDNAIYWYRKGFEVQPNEYAGINLATLLVLAGKEFTKCAELQKIGMTLNNLLGKKGSLVSLEDYWDVATFFEISVLAGDFSKASQAAECMFKLKPPIWYLKSTLGNIQMICRVRPTSDEEPTIDQQLFNFWLDFFVEATKESTTDLRFPVLVLEPSKIYKPSYITISEGDETQERSIRLWHVGLEKNSREISEWLFNLSSIKGVSTYKRDDRCLFLYVQQNADDFQLFYPSSSQRQRFHDLIMDMLGSSAVIGGEVDSDLNDEPIQIEYEFTESKDRVMLGRGTFGVVYAARDCRTQVTIAVKEIPITDMREVQPLHEEILLHSRLSHKNIVKYLGSDIVGNTFKIYMEQVPGGSLSALLRSKWGPLKDHEDTIIYYTKQILEGLRYLHDQKIVHRDIKGDNVLVNTYSGVVKISDFGTSKRLAGLNPAASSFKGTLQYMAPEVIDKGLRGHGAPADIWSLGCTIVEMATGKPPFIELGSPQAAMFKVGFYKDHPEIPESLSNAAKEFILRCFEPDPEKRATAHDLLQDPFLIKGRKMSKKTSAADYRTDRSISMPMVNPGSRPESPLTLASTLSNFSEADAASSIRLDKRRSLELLSPGSSEDGLETPVTPDNREQGGFYMLRKDSERRQTLLTIIEGDGDKIVNEWMKKLQLSGDRPPTKITTDHLMTLNHGIALFIKQRERRMLVGTLDKLRDDLDYDPTALSEIHTALYVFQDSVNQVLRQHMHNIKPHWMFALDSLIRDAVQVTITILSPDLGENIAPSKEDDVTPANSHGMDTRNPGTSSGGGGGIYGTAPHFLPLPKGVDEEAGNTSGVSTFDSSTRSNECFIPNRNLMANLQGDHQRLVQEQGRLLQELVDVQKSLNDVLQTQLCVSRSVMERIGFQPLGATDSVNSNLQDGRAGVEAKQEELSSWLQAVGLDEDSIRRFIEEDLTLPLVLNSMTRDDLRSLKIRVGAQVRIWDAVQQHRMNEQKR